ncbi:MAG: 50S ribosomal protein L28 [Magnetococcales bacterium]|nr:50S ribosomal protein L28 [Magnetococcales bacterium]
MANKCTLGGKAPQFGNKVSHSHRKSRRRWLVNIQTKNLYSLALGTYVKVSIPANMLRSVDRAGGLDNYLLSCSKESLDSPLRRIQEQVLNKQQKAAA